MKLPVFKILILFALLLSATSCRKSFIIDEKQILFFHYDHVNHAWGNQHYGFVIDNEGNVLTYNNPDGWNFADNELVISDKDIEENLMKCTPAGIKVEEQELQKYANYIRNIAMSKLTAPRNVAADAGKTEFICYVYSSNTGLYKGYLIKMEGDFTAENLNFYSKKVTGWMKDILKNIDIY
jgi:hypothetical protein